jgi:tetratricopeptide (TPR) repeat protein
VAGDLLVEASRRRALAVGLAVLLAGPIAACKGREGRAEELATQGVAHGRSGDLARALEAFDAALELDPKNLKALYNSGIALLGVGRGAEAAERFARFLELRPEDPLAHFHRGRALLREQRKEEALASLERAIELGFSDWVEWRAASDLEAGLAGDFRYVRMGLLVAQRAGRPTDDPRPGEGYANLPMPTANLPGRTPPRCVAEEGGAIACGE